MKQDTVLWAGPESLLPVELWSELQQAGYTVTTAAEQASALRLMKKRNPELFVAVAKAGNGFDLEFLKQVLQEQPDLPVVMVACEPTLDEAVEAMKMGIRDYVPGSLAPEQLMARLASTIATSKNGSHTTVHDDRPHRLQQRRWIGEDPATKKLLNLVRKVAPSRATLLIQGESGTGKELIARQIHSLSRRGNMPFVAVNCAALPQHLLESELFGHEKGAFTGALNRKLGKFELAHKGTLLLDEISEMDLALQAKLLRVLQESELDRVGGRLPVAIDTRVVATTNRNLDDMAAEGTFRQDLFYRLNVVRLVLPPLRERSGDILPLTHYFLKKSAIENNLPKKGLVPAAENALLRYPWPGNVRELENTIERAVLLAEGETIQPEDLLPDEPQETVEAASGEQDDLSLKRMEKRMIHAALDRHGGNRTHAAKVLGISVRTLRNKLNEYKKTERPNE